jgi:hypothetical protein
MSRAYVDVEVSFSVLFPGVRFAQMDLIGSFLNGIERNRQTETRLKTGKTCKGDNELTITTGLSALYARVGHQTLRR